jgi:hypothetical protein
MARIALYYARVNKFDFLLVLVSGVNP